MCNPEFYNVIYKINPWMDLNNQPSHELANHQWSELKNKIEELGDTVQLVKSEPNLPDMVFTANAALILKDGSTVIAKFHHEERKGEEPLFAEWFRNNEFPVYETSYTFEGAGDALYLGNTLIGGYGFRSNPDFYWYLRNYFEVPIYTVQLVNPYFYHLDTCFCPLDNVDYLIFPGAFDAEGLSQIRMLGGNEITVPEHEAKLFACNSVRVGRNVILPKGCPITMQKLNDNGYTCHPVDMSEYLKSGGACKCLTLQLGI